MRGQAAQRRSEAAAQSSQGGVVKALLAARAAGEIDSIHGRLGALRMPRGWHTLSQECLRFTAVMMHGCRYTSVHAEAWDVFVKCSWPCAW